MELSTWRPFSVNLAIKQRRQKIVKGKRFMRSEEKPEYRKEKIEARAGIRAERIHFTI